MYCPTVCLYAVYDRITLAVPISSAVILLISCRRDVQSADISLLREENDERDREGKARRRDKYPYANAVCSHPRMRTEHECYLLLVLPVSFAAGLSHATLACDRRGHLSRFPLSHKSQTRGIILLNN